MPCDPASALCLEPHREVTLLRTPGLPLSHTADHRARLAVPPPPILWMKCAIFHKPQHMWKS